MFNPKIFFKGFLLGISLFVVFYVVLGLDTQIFKSNNSGFFVEKAEAKCDGWCKAVKIARSRWNNFTSGSSSSGGSSLPGIGGNVTKILPCACNGGVAFILKPVPGTAMGPYFVDWGSLKLFKSVRPGAWVLGSVSNGGSCVQAVGPYCVPFSVYATVDPSVGLGTSN